MNKNMLLVVTSLAAFSASLLTTGVSIALPSIGAEFSMEAQLLGWVQTSFVLATAVAMVPLGRISDIYGRKKIFIIGLLLFIVSSFLCASAHSSILLITYRVFQGFGAAMIWGPGISILTSAFSAAERGRAIGINTASVYAGLSIGPFWGGFLTETLRWRSVFYITVVLAIATVILVIWKIKSEWVESRGEKLDVNGTLILAVSLILTLIGFSSLPALFAIPLIVLGLIGILWFYRVEAKTVNPVINVDIFKNNRVFVFGLLGMLALYCATFAPNFLLSLFLQYNQGYSPQIAGAILIIQPIIMAILAPVSGRISDKIEPLKVSALGMGITCIALVLFAFLKNDSPLWFILLGLAVLGCGFGLFASPVTNAVMGSVDKKYFGVAAGTQATMRHTGQVLSMGIVMILFAIYIGDVQITRQYYPAFLVSLKIAFAIFAGLCFAGILALFAGGKVKKS